MKHQQLYVEIEKNKEEKRNKTRERERLID